jgi:hypothetical protein
MLRVPVNLTFGILDDLTNRLGTAESRVLQVPSSALGTKNGVGVDGPLIQFLAAWRRAHDDAELYLAAREDSNIVNNLLKNPHGIAALYFARNVRFLGGESTDARPFLKQFLPRLLAMQSGSFRETVGQRGCHMASFAGAANEWLKPFYPFGDDSEVLNAERFPSLFSRIIESFDPSIKDSLEKDDINDLAHLYYELFDNTHCHARRSVDGELLVPSIRGSIVRRLDYRLYRDAIVSDIGKPFLKYISSMIRIQRPQPIDAKVNIQRFKDNLVGKNRDENPLSLRAFPFLELTVYDTGPGIASHFGTVNSDRESTDSLSLLKSAFTVGESSKSIRGSGIGLSTVLSGLFRMKGFLILRTNGVSLYQDFSFAKSADFEPEVLGTINKNLAENPTGSSFTLIVPLGIKR